MNSAKLIQVIATESMRGNGTESNPFRDVSEYWMPDGTKLAERDTFTRYGFNTLLRDRAKDLALCITLAKQSGSSTDVAAFYDLAKGVLDLVAKTTPE